MVVIELKSTQTNLTSASQAYYKLYKIIKVATNHQNQDVGFQSASQGWFKSSMVKWVVTNHQN